MNPRLKQRKTKIVSGCLTRDSHGYVILWDGTTDKKELQFHDGEWGIQGMFWAEQDELMTREWEDDVFKEQYTGIPRKGRAVYVQIEIVV